MRNRNLRSIMGIAAILSIPNFGSDDMQSVTKGISGKQNAIDGSKPSKKRKKIKISRKANLKNRK